MGGRGESKPRRKRVHVGMGADTDLSNPGGRAATPMICRSSKLACERFLRNPDPSCQKPQGLRNAVCGGLRRVLMQGWPAEFGTEGGSCGACAYLCRPLLGGGLLNCGSFRAAARSLSRRVPEVRMACVATTRLLPAPCVQEIWGGGGVSAS